MNTLVSKLLIVLGGLGLFGAAVVSFTAISGRPMAELPVFGSLFEAPPEQEATSESPSQGEETVAMPEPKTDYQLTKADGGVLSTFLVPSPFSIGELEALEAELAKAHSAANTRLARIAEREERLDEREKNLDQRYADLETLRNRLEAFELELASRQAEVGRDERVAEERERQSWKDVASFFEEGEAEDLVSKLTNFTPAEAARVLRALPPDRVSELVNALPADRYREYLDAYRSTQD